MKWREETEQSHAWLDTTILYLLKKWGADPALDELRVASAMQAGWRYREADISDPDFMVGKNRDFGVNHELFVGALQTSAWFTLDSDALHGIMLGADPAVDELPPLPFRRMALDGWVEPFPGSDEVQRDEAGLCPLVTRTLPWDWKTSDQPLRQQMKLTNLYEAGTDDEFDQRGAYVALDCLVIFEIEQGLLWDCLASYAVVGGQKVNRMQMGFHITPGGHTADYDALRMYGMTEAEIEWDAVLGHDVWKAAVTAVHMVTAASVRNVRVLPPRKQKRDWARWPGKRRYRPTDPRIYRVDLHTAYERDDDEPGKSGREYRVRWMVRGHYRHTPHGEYRHPATGRPASWVRAHVKGPAGAPWKGRAQYIEEPVA